MPTREVLPIFWRDWARLTLGQQQQFREAVAKFVDDLSAGEGFRVSLRVKGVRGVRGIYEMSWAADGRATFHYGPPISPGEPHIVWRRIGTHAILRQP
jgi:hypothetical protein